MVDCVSLEFAQDKGIDLIKVNPSNVLLAAANGSPLAVSHITDISVQLPGTEEFRPIRCLVSPDLKTKDIIIGWALMLQWGLLNLTDFETVQTNSYSPLQLYMLRGFQAFQLPLCNAKFLQNCSQ